MTIFHYITRMALLPTALLLATTGWLAPASATNVYQFTDEKGNVLLTNVVGNNKKPVGKRFEQYKTKVKVTYYKDSNIHQYKDWGSSNASVAPSQSTRKNAYDNIIISLATRHGVSASLIKAIMHTESGFNPNARSPVGAMGLMQLMPATAKRFGVLSPYDPIQNIEGGVKYLAYLNKKYSGNLEKMIAGYNAGEGNVDKYGGIPPFAETQDYVPRVLKRYHGLYNQGLSLADAGNDKKLPSQQTPPTNQSLTFDESNSYRSTSDSDYTKKAIEALR